MASDRHAAQGICGRWGTGEGTISLRESEEWGSAIVFSLSRLAGHEVPRPAATPLLVIGLRADADAADVDL